MCFLSIIPPALTLSFLHWKYLLIFKSSLNITSLNIYSNILKTKENRFPLAKRASKPEQKKNDRTVNAKTISLRNDIQVETTRLKWRLLCFGDCSWAFLTVWADWNGSGILFYIQILSNNKNFCLLIFLSYRNFYRFFSLHSCSTEYCFTWSIFFAELKISSRNK